MQPAMKRRQYLQCCALSFDGQLLELRRVARHTDHVAQTQCKAHNQRFREIGGNASQPSVRLW